LIVIAGLLRVGLDRLREARMAEFADKVKKAAVRGGKVR
jgi:hypothetical protein